MAENGTPKISRIDKPLIFLIVLTAGAAIACYAIMGRTVFVEVVDNEVPLLIDVFSRIAAAVLLAGFLQVLVPKEIVSKWLGSESGMKGLLIATFAGIVMPGGPITTFPLVIAFYAAGADMGVLVTFLVSWSILGFNRVIVWELPFLGPDFVFIRLLASMPLPILAGLIARRLPPLDVAKLPPGAGRR